MELLISSCGLLLTLAFFVGIGIGWWILSGKPAADARALQNKFVSLGTLQGKTREEIERAVGKPQSWGAIGDGRTSCSWSTQKYHITLIFDGDVCEGVSSEIHV